MRKVNDHVHGEGSILPYWVHGQDLPDPPDWIVRNRLPKKGICLLSGQWGTGKTFAWIDLSGAVISGTSWLGEPVYTRCGVLALTAEGSSTIASRFNAMIEHSLQGDPNIPMPFAHCYRDLPALLGGEAKHRIIRTGRAVDEDFRKQFDLPLGIIVIDTVAAMAGWTNEDDSAETSRLWSIFREISDELNALVMPVDHFGKSLDSGTRGSSAKEANSDAVIALLGERKQSGQIKNQRCALRKLRDGPQGEEFPFALNQVVVGTDDHGHPVTQMVMNWNVKPPARKHAEPKGIRALSAAIDAAMRVHGFEHTPPDGVTIRVVPVNDVRDEFYARYSKKPGTRRQAWNRVIGDLGTEVKRGTVEGTDVVWVV
jgi:hypothetical protein